MQDIQNDIAKLKHYDFYVYIRSHNNITKKRVEAELRGIKPKRLKAGVDFANVHGKVAGESYNQAETGFYAGGFADITVTDKFHVQPELLYVSVRELDQIQVPVLAKIPVVEDLSLLAGPDFGFLLNAGEGTKTFNFGLDLGLSFDLNEEFSLDGKYNLGLSNLLEDGNSDFSSKLSGFFFGLSYKF